MLDLSGGMIYLIFLLSQTDTVPNEVYFNLYGIHCDSHSTFQWENIVGMSVCILYMTVFAPPPIP